MAKRGVIRAELGRDLETKYFELPSRFDKRSFRWVRVPKDPKKKASAYVLIGCPKGKFKSGKCSVGTRAQKLMKPKKAAAAKRVAANPIPDDKFRTLLTLEKMFWKQGRREIDFKKATKYQDSVNWPYSASQKQIKEFNEAIDRWQIEFADAPKSKYGVEPEYNPLLMVVPNPQLSDADFKRLLDLGEEYHRTGSRKAFYSMTNFMDKINFLNLASDEQLKSWDIVTDRWKRVYGIRLAPNPQLMVVPNRKKNKAAFNPADYENDPRFKQALKAYREFHGCDPKSVSEHVLPVGDPNKIDGVAFFVSMGTAPADSYEPPKHSKKFGKVYVHPYDRKPIKAFDATGKFIVTLPSTHKVTDWIRG